MKKFILMAVAAMMATTSISAQGRFEPGTFTLQPRIGVQAATYNNSPDIVDFDEGSLKTKGKGGFLVGADLGYQVNDWFEVSAGVNWAQAGMGFKDAKLGQVDVKDLMIETSYINVPVTANFYVLKGLALKTGVQFGFLTSAKTKGDITAAGVTEKMNEDCKDVFNKFDLAIPVGISYEFKNHIVLDARYNFGITRANKEKEPGSDNIRNLTFAFTIGYKFGL